jgi:dihydrofolate synthase/folylpolyglutamate synthase
VETAKTALTGFSLPARFERISVTALGQTETVFIVDGAHTPGSVERCAQTFCGLYGEGGVLVFGCAKEKDIERMAELLVPRFSTVIVTAPGNFRASDPEAAYTVFQKAASRSGVRVTLVPDTTAAITKALRAANEQKLPLLGCGSFYLAGEIRKLLANPRRSFS